MFDAEFKQTVRRASLALSRVPMCIVAAMAVVATAQPLHAQSLQCPTVTMPEDMNRDTRKCLHKLENDFSLEVDVAERKTTLLIRYKRADQKLQQNESG